MTRTIARPMTEDDRTERAALLAVTSRVPLAAALAHLEDEHIAAGLRGHAGLGCTESYLFDEMACCTSKDDAAEPVPKSGLTPWQALKSVCAGFLAHLKKPRPDCEHLQ